MRNRTFTVQTQYRTGIEYEQNPLAATESSLPAIEVTGVGKLIMGGARQQHMLYTNIEVGYYLAKVGLVILLTFLTAHACTSGY